MLKKLDIWRILKQQKLTMYFFIDSTPVHFLFKAVTVKVCTFLEGNRTRFLFLWPSWNI